MTRAPSAARKHWGKPVLLALGLAVVSLLPNPVRAAGPQLAPAGTDASTTSTASAIVPGSVNRSSLALETRYRVGATLRYENGSMTVTATLDVLNTSGAGIDRLELNLVPARLGRLQLLGVTVDGRAVTASRNDQTLLVPLGGVLPARQRANVRVRYTAFFQTNGTGSNWMFSKVGGTLQAYRWIPWISRVRDFDRPNFGDPFVTSVSPRVEVTIVSDRPLSIATTGQRTSISGLKQTFVAERVRDFNLAASPFFKVLTGTVGDTKVQVFHRTAAGSSLMTWAKRAIERMEPLVGHYAYPSFVVAETAAGWGMESPGMIWIPSSTASTNIPYLVSHETAHQWFYAAVGNDQASEPFADEAATDFLARYTLGQRRASQCAPARLDATIYGYSAACYYETVYIQGGNFIDDLRKRMGSTAFWNAMRSYVATNSFRFSGTKRLLDALDAATSTDLQPTYEPRFPRYY